MAKIPRKLQKIFASSAANNGVIGSAQDGTKVLSADLDTLQSKAAFLTGFNDMTLSSQRLPTLEEMQALFYILTTQEAYLFQEGIPEYNSGTTYFINSIVKKSGTYQLYGSIVDNNTGNALTDATKWVLLTDLSRGTTQSLTTNGYRVFAGGLIIQWGTNALVSDGTTVTLPITYPNAHFATVTQNIVTQRYSFVSAFNLGSFDARSYDTTNGSFTAQTIRWISIGY